MTVETITITAVGNASPNDSSRRRSVCVPDSDRVNVGWNLTWGWCFASCSL